MEGMDMEGLTLFPLTCVYKSPSKTHQLMCHSAQVRLQIVRPMCYLLFLTRISRERSLVLTIRLAAAAEKTRSASSSTEVGGTVSK